MPFNATIDIFVNFSYVQVRFLNRQGYLCYRMKIFSKHNKSITNCHPYNILRGDKIKKPNTFYDQQVKQSEIDHDTQHYYSRIIPVRYRPADYQQNETVFFKTYIDMDKIDQIKFQCQIQCLFCDKKDGKFQVIGTFDGKIHRIYNISAFLPISFDAFEGFVICSTFHATIMQFKFNHHEQQNKSLQPNKMSVEKQTYDFWSYVDTVTDRFNRDSLLKFYLYYRRFLQNQLQTLQNRRHTLMKKFKMENKLQIQRAPRKFNLEKLIADKSFNSYCIMLTSIQEDITKQIENNYTQLKGLIYEQWMLFSNLVSQKSIEIVQAYRREYQMLSCDRFKNNVFGHTIQNHNWLYSKYNDSGRIAQQKTFSIKKKSIGDEQQLWTEHFPIQKAEHFGKPETNIKIFEEIYKTDVANISKDTASRHIIVLVHGFQASRQDFYLFKNCLQVNYEVQVIISTCNQGLTDSSICIAGKRLANQLKKMLTGFKGEYRLSFIGHSMGGLIIRAAIPLLQCFQDKFYTYMSLSSPHLGYLYDSSTIIRAGLWILNTIKKCDSMIELSMQDDPDIRKTTLYKLSFNKSLQKFNNICFVCSSQDQYVVYQSARIQINQTLTSPMSKIKRQIVKEMVTGILGHVNAPQISRINVVFNIEDKNLDSFLGRTGHIKFLNDLQFIREFCACYDKFLK